MKSIYKDDELHQSLNNNRNEEVVNIIESMPTKFGWIVSLVVVLLMLLILIFGWIIQYPDVLKGQITINTRQAPVKLVSNFSGSLDLIIKNGTTLKKGDYIACIKNGANFTDVKHLSDVLKNLNLHNLRYETHRHLFNEDLSLGELNQSYFEFLNSLYQFLDYVEGQSFPKQLLILNKQLLSQKKLLVNEMENYDDENEKVKIENGFYHRDSILFSKKIISSQEFEKSKQNLLRSRQQYKYLRKNLTNDEYAIKDIENKIQQLKIDNTKQVNNLEISMLNNYYQLKESIVSWERKYVFIAPMTGKLAYLSFLKNDDFLETGKELFSIVPKENMILGQVLLPEVGINKVELGQEVIIKLDNSPYTQFGSIRGKVTNISAVANEQLSENNTRQNNYLLTVSLPNNLKTNYGTILTFRSQAKGSAEVITNKRRLIERLFDNLKHGVQPQ